MADECKCAVNYIVAGPPCTETSPLCVSCMTKILAHVVNFVHLYKLFIPVALLCTHQQISDGPQQLCYLTLQQHLEVWPSRSQPLTHSALAITHQSLSPVYSLNVLCCLVIHWHNMNADFDIEQSLSNCSSWTEDLPWYCVWIFFKQDFGYQDARDNCGQNIYFTNAVSGGGFDGWHNHHVANTML